MQNDSKLTDEPLDWVEKCDGIRDVVQHVRPQGGAMMPLYVSPVSAQHRAIMSWLGDYVATSSSLSSLAAAGLSVMLSTILTRGNADTTVESRKANMIEALRKRIVLS